MSKTLAVIAQAIDRAAERAGGITKLAAKLGVGRSSVYDWRSGQTKQYEAETLVALFNEAGMSLGLLQGADVEVEPVVEVLAIVKDIQAKLDGGMRVVPEQVLERQIFTQKELDAAARPVISTSKTGVRHGSGVRQKKSQ